MTIDKRSKPILPNNLRTPSDYVQWLETKNRELRSENAELREALNRLCLSVIDHANELHDIWNKPSTWPKQSFLQMEMEHLGSELDITRKALAAHKPASDEIGK